MDRRVILLLVRAALLLACSVPLAACSQARLQPGQGKLVAPVSVDFGEVYLGATPHKTVSVANGGNAQLALAAAVTGDAQVALGSAASFVVPQGAAATVSLALTAARLGSVSATLALSGDASALVAVTAEVVADPACPQSAPCSTQTFDPNQGLCTGSPLPDGAPCDDGNQCETEESCIGGVCKGTVRSCDDQNVCTTDYCLPAQGCQHLDHSASCQGTDPCQIYYCDPAKGCQSTAASDGTPCNAEVECVQASVCLSGQCVGAPLPDGTPCIAGADPCAKDATCRSGVCDSPTADALRPGDILWKAVASELSDGDGGEVAYEPLPDAGPPSAQNVPGWRAAAAVDPLGNLYLDDDGWDGGGSLVSLDICGRERWRTNEWGSSSSQWTNGRHLLTNGIVITVAADQSLLAQSSVTGELLWRYDLSQAGVNPAGASGFTIEDIALSNDGIFYFTGQWSEPDGDGGTLLYGLVAGLLTNGQTKFATVEPAVPFGSEGWASFGYPLLVDGNEQLYTVLDTGNGNALIESFDQTGALRWTLPVARDGLQSFSDDQGLFVEPVTMTAFDANGHTLWSDTEPASVVVPTGHSPVVEVDGTQIVARRRLDPDGGGHGTLETYAPDGGAGWSFALPDGEFPVSSHVLDAQGNVYFATTQQRLVALSGQGGLLWQLALPTEGPIYQGVLALTPAGSLIVPARRELFSVYAGQPMSSSPWPRFRGDNQNRSCPGPQATGPSSPSP
ncbi:MAG: outer membrane protein assembly factor BamB family protein [Myxococcales bacterium]